MIQMGQKKRLLVRFSARVFTASKFLSTSSILYCSSSSSWIPYRAVSPSTADFTKRIFILFGFRLCIHGSLNQKSKGGAGINHALVYFKRTPPKVPF